MAEPASKPRPWLIAAWPGMGNVAVIAASYLIEQLGMTDRRELPPGTHFDVIEVTVKQGLVEPIALPRGYFFTWKNPARGRDLVVFIGEAQPSSGSYAYAHELVDAAREMGVERVVTFASLASGLHPSENPKVSGAATDAGTLAELRRVEVEPLEQGQIGGLNGLLLGVAAARGLAGMCLLAEIPYFAMRVPNPKASRAALSVFSVLAGIDIHLEELNKQAAYVDRALIDAIEQLERQRAEQGESAAEEAEPEDAAPGEVATGDVPDSPRDHGAPRLSPGDRERIDGLFEAARKDPAQAVRLKNELDRLGVFKSFEGAFLDLFRKAG